MNVMDVSAFKAFARIDWSPAQQAFWNAFEAQTERHTACGVEQRLWNKQVLLDVAMKPGDRLALECLSAYATTKGHGGRAMAWLLNLAEKYGQVVTLTALPMGAPGNPLADEDALRAWYGRRGFSAIPGTEGGMRRLPQAMMQGLQL